MKEQVYLLLLFASLMVLGIGLTSYLSGPKESVQHESATLYSGRIYVSANDWNYLETPIDGIPLFVNNTFMLANADSISGKITICLMNESQFSDWRANQNRSSNIIAPSINRSYNSSISPEIGQAYYFIFENVDNKQNSLDFVVTVEGDFLRFDYGPAFFYLTIAVSGGAICLVTSWKLSKIFAQWHEKWEEPMVGTRQMERDKDTSELLRRSVSFRRRILKYAVFVIVFVTVITYLPVLVQLIPAIVSREFLRPEYRTVFLDYTIRTFVFRFFNYLPSLSIMVGSYLLLLPRLSDLSRFARLKVHLAGPKQDMIGKELTRDLLNMTKSKKFITLLVVTILPFILARQVFSFSDNYALPAYIIAVMSIIGIYLGFQMGLSLDRVYENLKIGRYASRHFLLGSLLTLSILCFQFILIVYVAVLFNASSWYWSFLNGIFFSPVRLDQPFSLVANLPLPDLPMVAVVTVGIAFVFILLLMFLIPFLYNMTTREVVSATIVLIVAELTQETIRWIIVGTMGGFFQPSSFLAPFAASIVAGGLHKHYKRRIERTIKAKKMA